MTAPGLIRTEVLMGTTIIIQLVRPGAHVDDALTRAFACFRRVEACCSRFNPASELSQLAGRAGEPVEASPILYEALRFALAMAEATGGAFNPTVGLSMETRGFNREYSTGRMVHTDIPADAPVTFRDVRLDASRHTITLQQPLLLDLGAVAKGLAVDMAARELVSCRDFAIDAGGDLYLGGCNPAGAPWSVGIRHPRLGDQLIDTVHVSDKSVCTSGDYERPNLAGPGHHILDPRTRDSAGGSASVTVVAATAMLADALATAAFVLGPSDGLRLLERSGVDGLIVTPDMERHETSGWRHE